ncbi:MAG: hypothetical protein ACK5NT_04445 [Pyrinomonadaceae bacterium]
MEEKEFLQDYEIKPWVFNARTYKILTFSVAILVVSVVALSQTNLIQTKACDSYYIGKVCQTLDTVYVATVAFSGDNGYEVKEYERTKIDDADVIWVDQTGAGPKFTYPEGYFYKPESEVQELPGEGSTFTDPIMPPKNDLAQISPPEPPSSGKGGIWNVKPKLPKANKKVVSGDLPDSLLGSIEGEGSKEGDGKPKGDENAKNGKSGTGDSKNSSLDNKTAKSSDSVDDSKINKQPLYDFADLALERYDSKTVDFTEQFRVKLSGEIKKNGRLDPERTKYTEAIGDTEMVEVAKRGIESVGESGWLEYLSRFGVKKLDMVFAQNDTNLMAIITSDLPSEEKANTVATGLRTLISGALMAHNNGLKQLQPDEVKLLQAAKVSSSGNVMQITFSLPKPEAVTIITARLSDYKAGKDKKKNSSKPNGNNEKPSAGNKNAR